MTVEARVLFVLLFLGAWAFLGLLAWAAVAVARRGDGALLALPVSLAAACASGVSLPVIGLTDATGFFLSLPAAAAGSLIGYAAVTALRRRLAPAGQTARGTAAQRPPRE